MIRIRGIYKVGLLLFFIIIAVFAFQKPGIVDLIFPGRSASSQRQVIKLNRFKCNLSKPCPDQHFTFKMKSGAANILGPKMCLEDNILMSAVKNNVGRGINIAFVNGSTGVLIKTAFFDMWAGDVNLLINFLKTIENGTLVMMATFDDSSTQLNLEAKKVISDLGSLSINALGFRDNWIFVGGKEVKLKTPYEMHVKNRDDTNKYEGWPDIVEMEGCIPKYTASLPVLGREGLS